MRTFAFLVLPSANSVYTQASLELVQAELGVFDERVLGGRLREVGSRRVGGAPYVTFECEELRQQDVELLSNLSSLYALYELEGERLRPIELDRLELYADDLTSIQKYSGKTNELFTKLLLNVTLLSTAFPLEITQRKWRVLDPLCGRGTTLNQALAYGYDAAGIEVDAKDFEAYAAFIRTWLENQRFKHDAELGKARGKRKLQVSFGASKEAFKAGELQHLSVINADTAQATQFFGKGTFDVIVTDLPYGVQHASRADRSDSRRPSALLSSALPGWKALLREGGALGISWNTRVLSRERLVALLGEHGLEVADSPPYHRFEHRVAQAITRDLVVARRSS